MINHVQFKIDELHKKIERLSQHTNTSLVNAPIDENGDFIHNKIIHAYEEFIADLSEHIIDVVEKVDNLQYAFDKVKEL